MCKDQGSLPQGKGDPQGKAAVRSAHPQNPGKRILATKQKVKNVTTVLAVVMMRTAQGKGKRLADLPQAQ
jgi:hypothetical protein